MVNPLGMISVEVGRDERNVILTFKEPVTVVAGLPSCFRAIIESIEGFCDEIEEEMGEEMGEENEEVEGLSLFNELKELLPNKKSRIIALQGVLDLVKDVETFEDMKTINEMSDRIFKIFQENMDVIHYSNVLLMREKMAKEEIIERGLEENLKEGEKAISQLPLHFRIKAMRCFSEMKAIYDENPKLGRSVMSFVSLKMRLISGLLNSKTDN